ncbi:MAG: IscS subfamily cysteine desulfurase [Lachnospiraceae bacterium]|nr:IscS subfamily cysteine desulfurase [Lachnospiraceae bacterium]
MIYLDHAATTRVAPEVLEAMLPWLQADYGNPGALYQSGVKARNALRTARESVAALMHAHPEEIYFTSGGTEADNWALTATAEAFAAKGRHIITSRIEHHAVLHTCAWLERRGYEIMYLKPDRDGLIAPEEVERAIRPDTILISVMLANNEVGTIQPIAQIGALARAKGILLHTDAVGAFGQIPVDVEALQADLLSVSAHKLHGPKGVGCLYIRNGVRIGALLQGGAQERNRRAGTENVPGIVGFGVAAECAGKRLQESETVVQLREHMIQRLLAEIPQSHINGHRDRRLPGNIHISFDGIEAESLLIRLDMDGICASAGSACTSGSLEPSHVLLAMGQSATEARSSIRLTLGADNTPEEIDAAADAIGKHVLLLRQMRANKPGLS